MSSQVDIRQETFELQCHLGQNFEADFFEFYEI